jgi:CubicO group peptidase (beta-lactamase class C family)
MRRLIISFFCAAALSNSLMPAASAQQQQQQPVAPSPAAAQRVKEYVALVNSGDRQAARSYVGQNLTPSALARVPADGRVNTIAALHDETRGVEVHSVSEPKPGQVEATLRSKLAGEWWRLTLFLEPQPPHRIERLGMGIAPTPPDAQPTAKNLSDEERARELDAFMGKLAGADAFSGAVLLAKDGKVIFEKAYGEANKDFGVPNRADTKFNLGSMNKMFTAVAVAQLAEAGKLSFDDPLSKFLPDFPNKEAAEKIRIKHLLTHTSGLGSYFNERFVEGSRARFRTVDDFMALAKDETLAFEPGTKWQYSNTGFLVLGKVIERVTGQAYFDYVRERIFKPAGMTSTDSYELDRVNPNLAVGYQKEYTEEGARFRNNIFQHVIRGGPAGGGYSTVADLLRFASALRSGKLLGEPYVKTLLTPKPELNSPNYGYGFGLSDERDIAGHSGGFNGISANLDMFLDSGYTGVVLSNYGNAAGRAVAKIQQLVPAADKPRASSR